MKKATLLYCSTKLPSMKKLLLTIFTVIAFLTIVPIGLTSCTKENPTHDTLTIVKYDTTIIKDTIVGKDTTLSPYYVKATINGTNVSFTNYTAAAASYGGGIVILGHNNPDYLNSDGVTLDLYYSVNGSSTTNGLPPVGDYSLGTGDFQLFQAFVTDSGRIYSAIASSPTLDFHCTITTINSTYVSGTFYGTAYSGETPETITNGSFYVPF